MRILRLTLLAFVLVTSSSKAIMIEFLQASIDPEHVGVLSGLSCRNYDHIVHLDISVNWPDDSLTVEKTDYQRLVFWDKSAEYLFPKDTYFVLHGSYIIKGYFIARSGGMHQGIVSNAFEKVNDAEVMLSPNVVERRIKNARCK
jgi:hypothetical protein